MIAELAELIELSHTIGTDISLVQGGGGNISVKADDGQLYIKASGTPLVDMSQNRGWVALGQPNTSQRPSMEWPMHQALQAKWVCHTHSVYLNVFGCMVDGTKRLATVLKDLDYAVLPYTQPGAKLAEAIKQLQPAIIILQNHGLLVTGKTAEDVLTVTQQIHHRCAQHLPELFDPKKINHVTPHYYFPDAAVLADHPDIIAANAYIEEMILALGRQPHPLSELEVKNLRTMEEEQYRINLNQ